ncbi:MAG: SAM-dependent methyltransferase [Dehalococcoidia bacterium]|nr:SAM-dependent methyltransferase [Dehalococcoidia bacterium]
MALAGAEAEVHRRIRERGPITFAEFMEVALLWHDGGYYSDPRSTASHGDFYTAPAAHPAFGALLCLQLYQAWLLLESPRVFWVVEMGAGNGLLCHDVVSFGRRLPPGFYDSLRYLCLDVRPGPGLEARLAPEDRRRVSRLRARGVPLRGVRGCLVSNELLDSFPVHRVTVSGGELREVYVSLGEEALRECLGAPSTPALAARLASEEIGLAEGQTAEISLEVDGWTRAVSSALDRGFVFTVDYGDAAPELYARPRGTLTTFHDHVQTDAPLQRVGLQDITAHVDFTAVTRSGAAAGLETLGLTTQRELLHNLGLGEMLGKLRAMGLPQREADANRMGMLDIARPGGMGDFRVLVQGKGVGRPELWGLLPSEAARGALEGLPAPLRSLRHVPLMEGAYPHLGQDWEMTHLP